MTGSNLRNVCPYVSIIYHILGSNHFKKKNLLAIIWKCDFNFFPHCFSFLARRFSIMGFHNFNQFFRFVVVSHSLFRHTFTLASHVSGSLPFLESFPSASSSFQRIFSWLFLILIVSVRLLPFSMRSP